MDPVAFDNSILLGRLPSTVTPENILAAFGIVRQGQEERYNRLQKIPPA